MVVLQLPMFPTGWYFGWILDGKELQTQPRIGLAWQRVAVYSLGVLEVIGSEAEAYHSSKIV